MPIAPKFLIGTRVEAPGFTKYPRMTVINYEWREMDSATAHLRGWWLLCECDDEGNEKVGGELMMHPSWLEPVSAIDVLGELV